MQSSLIRDRRVTGSADRVLAVLDLLADRGYSMTSMAIAHECGVPRSTIYRLLNVLRSRGYLGYERRDRSWSLGPRLFQVGATSPTVAQVLLVLETFDARTLRLSVTELARRTGLEVSRVSQLADLLLAEGLLSADERGRLGLGLRIVGLAARAEPVEHLLRVARPYLEQLRDRTGETANLLVRDGVSALYLDQVESPRALRVSGWIGRRIPLAGSASGAALTEPGVHVVSDAVEAGVVAVACGVPGIGAIQAAISITAPMARLLGSLLARAEAEVARTASAIAHAMATEGSRADPAHEPRTHASVGLPTASEPSRESPRRSNGRRRRGTPHSGPERTS